MSLRKYFYLEGPWTSEERSEFEKAMGVEITPSTTFVDRGWLCTCYALSSGRKVFIANDLGTSTVLVAESVAKLAESIGSCR